MINLKNGEDIVMQMDPRVLEKRFIFNSFYNGHWQIEETIPMIGGPFIADVYYTVDFVPTRFHSVFRRNRDAGTLVVCCTKAAAVLGRDTEENRPLVINLFICLSSITSVAMPNPNDLVTSLGTTDERIKDPGAPRKSHNLSSS
ncbi:hypothetical protein Y032_0009g793 [Ancylostoma ceylanicum]|nr:hypothetical protein Y032_0009g793 [Ancylostoma ceylanicum]